MLLVMISVGVHIACIFGTAHCGSLTCENSWVRDKIRAHGAALSDGKRLMTRLVDC